MPFPYEASVIHHNGHDYWRTWFFEECEKSGLFGITEKHLPLLKAPSSLGGYQIGTEVFLEDAPYFKASRTHHLICGPYQVVEANLPDGAMPIHEINGKTIIYKEKEPQNGPILASPAYRSRLPLSFGNQKQQIPGTPYIILQLLATLPSARQKYSPQFLFTYLL